MPIAYVPSEYHAHTFISANATCPENAKTLDELECPYSWTFRRLVSKGVILQCEGDRFYLDLTAYHSFVNTEKRLLQSVGFAAISTIVIIFIVIWVMAKIF